MILTLILKEKYQFDMTISLIAAIGKNNEIGYRNRLLWHISADLKRFKSITSGHTVIMGQKTFESLGSKPLPRRKNIVISDQPGFLAEGIFVATSIEDAMRHARNDGEVFIIGGASIYRQFLPFADKLYLTDIHKTYTADTYFPAFDQSQWKVFEQSEVRTDEHSNLEYSFRTLFRIQQTFCSFMSN